MPRVTHADPELVYTCPGCDVAGGIYRREGDNTYRGDPNAPYICEKCGATFYTLKERSPHPNPMNSGGKHGPEAGMSGLSRVLADMDPEDAGLSPLGGQS